MKTNLLVTAAFLVTIGPCNLATSPGETDPLTFEILEGHWVDSPPPPQIVLRVVTNNEYPCMNYWIESELGVADHTLRVEMSGRITIGEVCLTAIGPAQYKTALPITEGTYTLVFARDGLTDRYTLTVTEAAFEVATLEARFTGPTAVRFPRGGQSSDSEGAASRHPKRQSVGTGRPQPSGFARRASS